jgi:stalled ribosome rescue protein Dom34
MRFNPKHLDSEARGGVFITPETVEDLWHVYCIIQVGDHMTAAAYRKVIVYVLTVCLKLLGIKQV